MSKKKTQEPNLELEQLQAKLQKESEAKLQVMADFENFRQRMQAERATFGAVANMALIQEFLEVYDDLQMAMSDQNLDLESAKVAIQNAQSKLIMATKSAGVEALDVKPGDVFDQNTMEAVTAVPDQENKQKVMAVISTGFKYANKEGIIKAAKVVIGK
jgi:molecular chaperone GrpE